MKNKFYIFLSAALLCITTFVIYGAVHSPQQQKAERLQKAIDTNDIPLATFNSDNNANEKKSAYIANTIEKLIGNTMKKWCENAKITYPPACVLFRAFKLEKEYEIWGGNNSESLNLIQTLKICSVDDQPGPKLIIGDGKTPEGFYTCDLSYGSQFWWMWIKLSKADVDKQGKPNVGSSFKICTSYPNAADQFRTKLFVKGKTPGAEICIHGNCVSAGCISFNNRVFLSVFYFAYHHNTSKYGAIQLHLFPFHFSEKNKIQYAGSYELMNSKSLTAFFNNLEEGYNLFDKNHKLLHYSFNKDKYIFVK